MRDVVDNGDRQIFNWDDNPATQRSEPNFWAAFQITGSVQ